MKILGISFLVYALIYIISMIFVYRKVVQMETRYQDKQEILKEENESLKDTLEYIESKMYVWKATQNTGKINRMVWDCLRAIKKELSSSDQTVR